MRMQLAATLIVLAVLCAKAGEPAAAAARARPVSLAGTFSGLEYNEEAGDLLGVEIKLVPWTEGHYRAAVLIAEGSPTRFVIVDVSVRDGIVKFTVPATDLHSEDGFEFRGKVVKANLTGTITYASGTKEQVTVRKRCGYWDR
jgi:hypothetical protein